jgi:hypothetical protein
MKHQRVTGKFPTAGPPERRSPAGADQPDGACPREVNVARDRDHGNLEQVAPARKIFDIASIGGRR